MVVVGWVAGAAMQVLFAVGWDTVPLAIGIIVDVSFGWIFIPSPVYFTILCWNNVDWQIMRLLLKQLQFKMVLALALHVIVMDAWRFASLGEPVLSVICWSVLIWSPLVMILFIDALRRQSKLFRFAMPVAYLLYVIAGYISYGYIRSPHPISPNANSTDALTTAAAEATFTGQISSSLSTLAFLMMSFLKNTVEDALRAAMNGSVFGSAIAFPMKIATVMKNTVPLLLEGGGKLKTEVNEKLRQVVLVPDGIFNGGSDDCAEIPLSNNPAKRSGVAAVPGLVGP
jgi:hypothetical protein